MFAIRFNGIDGNRHEVRHIADIRTAQRDVRLLRLAGVVELEIVREATGAPMAVRGDVSASQR